MHDNTHIKHIYSQHGRPPPLMVRPRWRTCMLFTYHTINVSLLVILLSSTCKPTHEYITIEYYRMLNNTYVCMLCHSVQHVYFFDHLYILYKGIWYGLHIYIHIFLFF